ncbi:hypothetical protein ACS0TY_010108 [Phlomoides rotata]
MQWSEYSWTFESDSSLGSDSNSKKSKRKQRPSESENEKSKKYRCANPLIRCVWTGNLDVWHREFKTRNYRFSAFLSSKAFRKDRRIAGGLRSEIRMEMMPRSGLLPKSFRRWGPIDDDIALFFFPPLPEHEKPYDSLVNEMIRDDLAMTACVKDPESQVNSDLLIFTSVELPWQCRRFQGKFYLWGVFY